MNKEEILRRRKEAPTVLDRLARAAYGGYGLATDGKKHDGTPLMAYDELGPNTQAAWEAAAITAVGCYVDLEAKADAAGIPREEVHISGTVVKEVSASISAGESFSSKLTHPTEPSGVSTAENSSGTPAEAATDAAETGRE